MTHAFATEKPRGFSWIGFGILAVALTPASLGAQTPPNSKTDGKPATEGAKTDDAEPVLTEEVFVDPNAKKALTVFNPLNFVGLGLRIGGQGDDRSTLQNMTARQINLDPEFIKRYIEFFTVELTRRENLNGILNPAVGNKPNDAARGLERAVNSLNKPIIDAKGIDNREFLAAYYRALFESNLPKLLEPNHNYLSRIDAMIVLGMAGNPSPAALDLYIAQLKKPDQLIWVKLWAARGLSIAAQDGMVDLDATKANLAAEALVGWLDSDPKLPWPAQMRALEAIGSLRVATASTSRGKVDIASVAMKYLSDPEAKPIVRAWAAWALGVLKIPGSLSPYNFTLVGQEIGELTVDIGNRIVQDYDDDPASFDKDKDLTAQLSSFLIFQVYPSLIGVEGVRDSGLLRSTHRNANDARDFLKKVDEKVKAVSRSAYDLLKAAGAGNKDARNDLDSKLADLKTTLAKSSPKDRRLVPGGPEFLPNPIAQVVGAAGR